MYDVILLYDDDLLLYNALLHDEDLLYDKGLVYDKDVGVPKENPFRFCLISPVTNMIEGWYIFFNEQKLVLGVLPVSN